MATETFETKESRELRLWYVEASIYPSKKYRSEGAKSFVGPVIRRFQIWYHDWFGYSGGEALSRFFDSCDDEGCFQIKDLADNTGFCRVHLDGYIPSSRPLTLAEAIYGESYKDRIVGDVLCDNMGENTFNKFFLNGEGKITSVSYAPASFNNVSLWYKNLYTTNVTNIARMFSYHDFVHILGKSSPILEEQIRRYQIPQKGVK